MSCFSEEIDKFLEVTLSLIAEVKNITLSYSSLSEDYLTSLKERLLTHYEAFIYF